MSYLLPHLHSGYAVDQVGGVCAFVAAATAVSRTSCTEQASLLQALCLAIVALLFAAGSCNPQQAILGEEERVVVIRFGHDWDPQCMQQDEILASVADQMKNFAVIFLVDISEVPDFNTMYELYDPCTTMFFFRNKHIMVDLGTGVSPF